MHRAVGGQQFGLLGGGVPGLGLLVGRLVRGVVLLRGDGGTAGGAQEVDVLGHLTVVEAGQTTEDAPASPTGQNSGVGCRPISVTISSTSSSGSLPGRSHLSPR